MKKIIFLTILVIGIVLTTGQGSKLVAGDRAHVIEAIVNSTRQIKEAHCRAQRTVTARDSGSKTPSQKCDSNDISINWDVVLNLFAEYFACREENGNSECAIDYCRCTLKIDDDWGLSKQNVAKVICTENLLRCETDRTIETLPSK